MAYYLSFNKMLLNEAGKLAEIKGKISDATAADDLYVLKEVMAGKATCIDIYALDERLRKEYDTIEQLESKESIYAFGDNNKIVSGSSETEKMILRLQSDRRGILADVLIKHGHMKCAEKLYKKIEK